MIRLYLYFLMKGAQTQTLTTLQDVLTSTCLPHKNPGMTRHQAGRGATLDFLHCASTKRKEWMSSSPAATGDQTSSMSNLFEVIQPSSGPQKIFCSQTQQERHLDRWAQLLHRWQNSLLQCDSFISRGWPANHLPWAKFSPLLCQ